MGYMHKTFRKLIALSNIWKAIRRKEISMRFRIIQGIFFNHPNPEKKLHYALQGLQLAQVLHDTLVAHCHLHVGLAYRLKGELNTALSSLLKSLEIFEREGGSSDVATLYLAIADVYSNMGNSKSARAYYSKSISALREN